MEKSKKQGIAAEELIYDVDGVQGSRFGDNCPKFVRNGDTISMIDRAGKRSDMTVPEFNQIARAFKSGEIKEQGLTTLRRK